MRYYLADTVNKSLGATASVLSAAKFVSGSKLNPLKHTKIGRVQNALLETSIRVLQHYPKRGWNYPDIKVGRKHYPIEETLITEKPFCKLMKFRRSGLSEDAPKVLFVAAMSGHHATLSRETFQEYLPDHEIYVTDWTDAREVPLEEGRFGFEEYISYVVDFLKILGPGIHMVGLCQAGIPGLAAAAILAQEKSDCRPASMTFLASPMDIQINPGLLTKATSLINSHMINALAIHKVPARYPGRGRRVYPGIVQLGNFMTMSISSHIESHAQFFKDIYHGNVDDAEKFRDFYDEYFCLLDATAEFYIETLENVFIDQTLPKGLLNVEGKKVDCAAIKDIPLFTSEGKKDNMVTPGQCHAAASFCKSLPSNLKESYAQAGVGHYGVFSGSKYRNGIAPKIKSFIKKHHQPVARLSLAKQA